MPESTTTGSAVAPRAGVVDELSEPGERDAPTTMATESNADLHREAERFRLILDTVVEAIL
ncbi:MAG TPA: hypothetical protein VGO15_11065, partial [Candidatus Limnocylindrales bacterium]|nr:hypothetical protein [Candidatus Limnocylindrales bacterium]